METLLKQADKVLQLILLILIVICGISFIGWMFLMFLFPALAVLQLLSAGVRTIFEFKKTDWHRRTFRLYWIMVGCWAIINLTVYLTSEINDLFIITMMAFSLPIAIWYSWRITKEGERIEAKENTGLVASMK